MIERVHEHIISELGTNSRTDTIFILTGIILNLIVLAINSAIASGDPGTSTIIVMFALVALLIVVNLIVEFGLIRGRQTRVKLLNGLIKMYQDQGVADYYDQSLLSDYKTRYNLFMFGVLFIGIVAIIIPIILLAT